MATGSRRPWVHAGWIAGLFLTVLLPVVALATHEADHRFTVDGFVCGADGKPSPNVEVLVKDTRVTIGATVSTEDDGYYKVVLHLHNDNVGDPVLVSAKDQEHRIKVQFDPKDLETERRVRVNFGSGCETERDGASRWMLYGLGLGVAAVAGFAGLRFFRRWKKRARRQGKGQGKPKKT